jgi:hypothetical protein
MTPQVNFRRAADQRPKDRQRVAGYSLAVHDDRQHIRGEMDPNGAHIQGYVDL